MTTQPNLLSQIIIILVETETPGNLGASARALKSMGLKSLRLVNPNRLNSREAVARAVGAQDILQDAQVFTSLLAAIQDCILVIGTTGKIENLDQPRYTPKEIPTILANHQTSDPIALVFGRESKGLSREELSLCNAHIRIPTHPQCPSLNLAAAVQIVCYELFMATNIFVSTHSSTAKLASHEQLNYLLKQLETLAIEVKVLDPDQPRQMVRRLRELYSRNVPRKAELDLMIQICKRVLQRLS